MEQNSKKEEQFSILIVDDTVENLKYLSTLLRAHGYDVRASADPEHALSVTATLKPDLILLDIKMPKIDGFTFAKRLKSQNEFRETPIIFISALDSVDDKLKAFSSGGVDYITKPFHEQEVLVRVGTHLNLYKSRGHIKELLLQQDYFIKKIMHEMNTPLSVITLNAQILERSFGAGTCIDTIKASSKILASIYNDMAYLVKKEQRKEPAEWINIVEFSSSRIAYFHEIAAIKEIKLDLEVEAEYALYICPTELERIIDNTLSNAIKYSPQNSTIEFLVGQVSKGTFIAVIDNGYGIENAEKIFDAYYQGASSNKGLGIGLATVKEICDRNSITIDLQSNKEGSRFDYYFPNTVTREL
ncbi:MAG TPA: hybrid sensor histidine kinase/response regulator [Nitratifractor sp.]|nr:hybrid sensor histidine kinase/response regulator [Nitratifractor sp.]